MATRKTERRSAARRLEHVVIECVTPELDGGRHPVKRVVGDLVAIGADVFKEGHDQLSARVIYFGPGDATIADDFLGTHVVKLGPTPNQISLLDSDNRGRPDKLVPTARGTPIRDTRRKWDPQR